MDLLQLPEYYELQHAIQHEFQLFDVLGDGKSRIVIFQLDFVESSILMNFGGFECLSEVPDGLWWI